MRQLLIPCWYTWLIKEPVVSMNLHLLMTKNGHDECLNKCWITKIVKRQNKNKEKQTHLGDLTTQYYPMMSLIHIPELFHNVRNVSEKKNCGWANLVAQSLWTSCLEKKLKNLIWPTKLNPKHLKMSTTQVHCSRHL